MIQAFRHGSVDEIEQLRQADVPLPPNPVELAYEYGTEDRLLDYLLQRGYVATTETINHAAKAGRLSAIQQLVQQGVQPTERAYLMAAAGGHLGVLQWLDAHEVSERRRSLSLALGGGHVDVASYLVDQGMQVSEDDVRSVLTRRVRPSVEYLYTIVPELFHRLRQLVVHYGDVSLVQRVFTTKAEVVDVDDVVVEYYDICLGGSVKVAQYLHDLGVPYPREQLYSSTLDVLRYYSDRGISVNPRLLASAARQVNVDALEFAVVEQGIDLSTHELFLDVLLHNDAGDTDDAIQRVANVVSRLIEWRTPINTVALVPATRYGSTVAEQVFQYAIDVYGEERLVHTWSYRPMFIAAAAHGYYDLVVRMNELREKYDSTSQSIVYDQLTEDEAFDLGLPSSYPDALSAAINNGRLDVARYLLSVGYDQPVLNDTPAIVGDLSALKFYFDRCATVRCAIQSEQLTRLLNSVACGGVLEVVDYLIDAGAVPTTETMAEAISSRNLRLVKRLHEHYAISFDHQHLYAAISQDSLDLVKYILTDVNCSEDDYLFARLGGHTAIARYLSHILDA